MNKKLIIASLSYLSLLSCLSSTALASGCDPPCDASACEACEDGACVYQCGTGQTCCNGECCNTVDCEVCEEGSCKDCAARYGPCCKCEDSSCVGCKCWDVGSPICGSTTVQDAKLCEEVTHTSSILDTDHWATDCPTQSEDFPDDSIIYYWIAGAGTPPTSFQANFTWTAPPCTGPVSIYLIPNDEPDPMEDPCPDSSNTRDDSFIIVPGTSTVSLPEGCSNAGPHDSSVHWINPDDDYASWTCTVFGVFNWLPATYDVDFKYQNCTWVCEISNIQAYTRIRVRAPASLLPDQVSVEQASDVPCDEAELAKFDLDDTDLSDDEGAPHCKYWCYSAVIAHEEKHRWDWQKFCGEALNSAITTLESLCHSNIYCADEDTITCQRAENYWYVTIQQYFALALTEAVNKYNDPDTPLKEHEQRAYLISYEIEQPISAALPEGCTP